jgi:hypothetical protein
MTNASGSFSVPAADLTHLTVQRLMTSNVTTPVQQYDCAVVGCFVVAVQGAPPNQIFAVQTLTFVTLASLQATTSQYVIASGEPGANGVATSLNAQLQNNHVCNYIKRVQQEVSKPHSTLTIAQANELIAAARVLDPSCP